MERADFGANRNLSGLAIVLTQASGVFQPHCRNNIVFKQIGSPCINLVIDCIEALSDGCAVFAKLANRIVCVVDVRALIDKVIDAIARDGKVVGGGFQHSLFVVGISQNYGGKRIDA